MSSFKDKLAFFGAKAPKTTTTNVPKNVPSRPANTNTVQNMAINNNVAKIENGNNLIQKPKIEVNSNNSTPKNNINETNKPGMLNNKKHPVIGSTFIEQVGKLKIYQYPKDVKFSNGDKTVVIIFVGQTGAGKSTFINAYLNYLTNISYNDNIRYKIIRENTSTNQTQSQTAEINIYNIRSTNTLFQLIDTPGACDTNQKDEKFVQMYKDALDKVEKLNSIAFVYNAGDVRETELQKKVVKNITNLFANNIHQNCLAALTHANNEVEHDAVQLLQKMDVFKMVKKSGTDWYFPVNSRCYFIPFEKGDRKTLMVEGGYYLSEESFQAFTQKVFKLKELMTNQTLTNLKIKKEQKDIIDTLETNLLNVLFVRIKKLKETDTELQNKIKEIEIKENEIVNIEKEIKTAEENRNLLQANLKSNEDKYNDIKNKLDENNKKILQLQTEINTVNSQIEDYKKKQLEAENEEKKILAEKADIDLIISSLNEQILLAKKNLNSKVADKNKELETINNLEKSLQKKKEDLGVIDKNLKAKEEIKKTLDEKKRKLEDSQKTYQNQINDEKKEEEKLKIEQEQQELEKRRLIQESIYIIEKEKEAHIKSIKEAKDKYIKILLEEKQKKIKELNDSKNEQVEFPTIKLIDDPNNERNLTCTKCKQICHKECDCLWGIPLLRPVVFCHHIKDGKCIVCKCSKDDHNRKITKYITVLNKRKKNEKEIQEIENKIRNIINEYDGKIEQYEGNFKNEINNYIESIEYKKEAKTKNIEISNQTNTIIDIRYKQKDIKNKQDSLNRINTNLNNTSYILDSTVQDINNKIKEKNIKSKEIKNDEIKKTELTEKLKEKESLIKEDKNSLLRTEAQKNKISSDYESKKSSVATTIENAKRDIQSKTNDLTNKQEELSQLQKLNNENDLQSAQSLIDQNKIDLNTKNDFINTKSSTLEGIRNDLTNNLLKEKNNLESLKKTKNDEANSTKEEMFRKLCIIKILNKEMEEITLNKETINSLDEIIDNLSKKFLDDRPLFLEIIKEFKDIVQKLDNPNLKPNPLYKRFDINEDDFKDIRLRKNK